MGEEVPLFRRGMILGKFMPPTQGHRYLAEFGQRCCQRLSVLVCSTPSEPIPGNCRYAWMREMLPGCDVVHVPDDLPAAPEDHPDFWALWLPVIHRAVGEPIDVVFTSEVYGAELARRLGARHLVVDPNRAAVPVSGTVMRANPYPRPSVAIDIVMWQRCPVAEIDNSRISVLLIRRGEHPFMSNWALPGGFVRPNEDVEQAAARELREESGLTGINLKPVGVFSRPGRDPRGWIISCAFAGELTDENMAPIFGDDAIDARWFAVHVNSDRHMAFTQGDLSLTANDLAFDHAEILRTFLDQWSRS